MEQQTDQIFRLHQRGLKRKEAGKLKEARAEFYHARKQFAKFYQERKTLEDSKRNQIYIINELEIARIELQVDIDTPELLQKKREISKSIIQTCQKSLDKLYIIEEIKRKLQYRVYSDLADIYCSILEDFGETEDLKKVFQNIDSALLYYKKARDEAIKAILYHRREFDGEAEENYIKSQLNMIYPLLIEAEKSKDKAMYQIVIDIAKKIQIFYKEHENQKNRQLVAKTYYFHGIAAMKLRKFQVAYKFLKQDFDYCCRQNKKQDRQKTQQELIKYYLIRADFDEVLRLINPQKKQFLTERKNRYIAINNRGIQILKPSFLEKFQDEQYRELKSFLEEVFELIDSGSFEYEKFAYSFLQKIGAKYSSTKKQICYLIKTYTAEIYAIFEQYEKGFQHEKQALSLVTKLTEQHIWQFSQHIDYLFHLRSAQLRENYQEFRRIISAVQNKGLINNEQRLDYEKIITEYQILEKRREIHISFRQKQIMTEQERSLFSNLGDRGEVMSQQSRPNVHNLKQGKSKDVEQTNYERVCRQKKYPVRIPLLEKIKNNNSENLVDDKESLVNLSELFLISNQELFDLIVLFQIYEWDLRNFIISPEFINSFNPSLIDYNQIKTLKIQHSAFQNYNDLFSFIYQLHNISFLHLQHLHFTRSDLSRDAFCSSFFNPESIKVLKLKDCHIYDSFFSLLVRFSCVRKLNLKRNYIQGYQMYHLQNLLFLQELNLSENPLSLKSSVTTKRCLKKLKLKSLKINLEELESIKEKTDSYLMIQLNQSQIIDLSLNSTTTIVNLLTTLSSYNQERDSFYFDHITRIILRKVNVTTDLLQQLNMLIVGSPQLQLVDMRFCFWDDCTVEGFISNAIHHREKVTQLKYEGQQAQRYNE